MSNQIQLGLKSSDVIVQDQQLRTRNQLQNASDDQVFIYQKDLTQSKPSGFFQMFRFADRTDIILMIVGTIFALANGAALPLFSYLWGDMIDSFNNPDEMNKQTLDMLLMFIYIGLGVFAAGWIMTTAWLITGQRQSIRCRRLYLKSLLRQQIGWFDLINQAQLSSQFSSDTLAFQGAMSDKIPMVLYVISLGISGMVIAFVTGWLLTFVMFGVLPVIIGFMMLYIYHIQSKGKRQQQSYAIAGGRAQQAISSIKTIKMMNGQSYQSIKYDQCLKGATDGAVKFGIFTGIALGGGLFAMLSTYSLGFWFGSHCINQSSRCEQSRSQQQYKAGTVFTVVFSIITVGFNMSHLPTSLKKITQGRVAAGRIFKIIDRKPRIQNPVNGKKIQNFKGIIKFHNVHFSYPKQPNKKILNGINLTIDKNKIAFVGQSGCGKSTLMQLLLRFYDPDQGYVTVDGINLKQLDLTWFRQNIGYVGQQPVLFATTIRQNLLYAKQDATQQQLVNALVKAQAYQFVSQLQNKMDTYVGFGGGQISGGQKQRLAIARAILKDPKILLLDQATSALDRKNQKLIQNTLNKISQSRISITIAHRVKTVMSSDQIFVIDLGQVKQQGKFKQLNRFAGIDFQQQQQNKNFKNVQQQEQKKQIQAGQITKKLSKKQQKLKQKQQAVKKFNKGTYARVFSYAKGQQILFIVGIISSGVLGCIYPVFTIFLSSLLQIMLRKKDFIDQASTRALIFFLLGILGVIVSIIQNVCFQILGGNITSKIRSQVFYKMMKLPIYWYQRPKNSVGALTSRLAVDCKQVKQMTTTYVYTLIQIFVGLICGLIIAFIYQWHTALVALGLIPFLILAGGIRAKFRSGSAQQAQQTYDQSSNLIMQSMTNIRTVCSFGYQEIIYRKYSQKLDIPQQKATKSGLVGGFFYGLSQFIMFIVIALIMFIGSKFVMHAGASIEGMFTAIFSIFFSAMSVGNNSHLLPDMSQCKLSAANLFQLLDTKDQQQIQVQQNSKLLKKEINGDFEFKNIVFKYQTRTQYIFNNFSLTIPYGQKVAFVGTSGCGKSTIMSFLLRFYQPQSGQILLDGVNIKDYDIQHLRRQFGVVSQQPTLFNDSIKQNIIYNLEGATHQQMVQASKKAHAYHFITTYDPSNPNGGNQIVQQNITKQKQMTSFERNVGMKGGHISGGQKQRIAIARAILRKPNILLLDEATSALDSVNQMKVQSALDQIMQGKSSISIAHRLDTIKNSKYIYVFDKGRVAQYGNYNQLMDKKGYFYNLQQGIQFK